MTGDWVSGPLRERPLNDGNPCAFRHCIADIAQDCESLGVVPLLEHVLQQIEIGLDRDSVEVIARHQGDALAKAELIEQLQEGLCHLDHMRLLEQDAGKMRKPDQERRE